MRRKTTMGVDPPKQSKETTEQAQGICGAIEPFARCTLPAGHTCRHRQGSFTWLDDDVIARRAARKAARKAAVAKPEKAEKSS